jgi:hypothetical protein
MIRLTDAKVHCTLDGGPLDGVHTVSQSRLRGDDYQAALVWAVFVATECGMVGRRTAVLAPAVLRGLVEGGLREGMFCPQSHYYEITFRRIEAMAVFIRGRYLGAE